jgi:hypothetical protein
MARKKGTTRKALSVKSTTYDRIKFYVDQHGGSVSGVLEDAIKEKIGLPTEKQRQEFEAALQLRKEETENPTIVDPPLVEVAPEPLVVKSSTYEEPSKPVPPKKPIEESRLLKNTRYRGDDDNEDDNEEMDGYTRPIRFF